MDREHFKSELGDTYLYPDRIERIERRGDWSRIKSEFDENELLDSTEFEAVEEIDFKPGSYYSILKIKIDDSWRRLFFMSGEAEKFFKHLKYRLDVYRQNH